MGHDHQSEAAARSILKTLLAAELFSKLSESQQDMIISQLKALYHIDDDILLFRGQQLE